MPGSRIVRRSAVDFLRNFLLLFCLFAPSAWMIATIPPLWRDSDAYIQLTESPRVATYWGHAPAYCYAAKIPLFIGEQWEQWRGKIPAREDAKSSQTRLTDSGIWLLIISQHLALCAAALCFIHAISKRFWIRLALALFWAGNAMLYTFAHCVGSETLSMIVVVVLALKALRLVQHHPEPSWKDWYLYSIALWLCILSRQLNSCLIALLPLTYLLAWAQNRATSLLVSGDRKPLYLQRRAAIRHAVTAIAVGIACLAVASFFTRNLAGKTRFYPHSRVGFTFLWRLNFLKELSPESRTALLQKVAAQTHSEDARKLIALVEQMQVEGPDLHPGSFMQRALPLLFPQEPLPPWDKVDRAVNQMAFAFLLPPTAPHLHATKKDLVEALEMPPTEISAFLFATTTYYFQHKEDMPGCETLVTFRHTNADQISSIPFQHVYFRLWQSLSYNKALADWLVTLLAFIFASRKHLNSTTVPAFGIALVAVGLFIVAATCLLDEFSPRFGLPMWQLLFLSLLLFVGMTADLLIERRSTR